MSFNLSTSNQQQQQNLPPLSLACADNDVAEHPGTSETESKDISPLIEGFVIGDADEAFVEDAGEENNSTKMAPPDGEKKQFSISHLQFLQILQPKL